MKKKTAHKRGGWKAASADGKKHKQTKLAIIVLVTIISVLLFGQTIRFIDSLFEPITKYSTFSNDYSWDGKTNLNLVIKSGSSVTVASFDPFEKNITLVAIPPETYVEVPGGYGKWQVRAIYDLGQSEDAQIGAKLLADSMSSLLGLPITGIIETEDDTEKTAYEFVKSLKENPFNLFSYLGNVNSSLTTVEFSQFAYKVSQLRFDKIVDLKLEDFNLLTSKTIPDGTDVLVAEPLLLDNFIIDKLSESKFKEEQISIAVFNGTKTPGLATKVARMLTNMGGNVIISTNASFINTEYGDELEKSFITSSGVESTYTLERLRNIFSLDCSNNPNCDKMPVDKITSRAQINVVVGKDFVE